MIHLHKNYFILQKKMLLYKKLQQFNFHKIEDTNKMKIYSQIIKKLYNKYL